MLSLFPLLIFLLAAVAYAPIAGLESAIMGFFNDLLPKQGARLIEGTVKQIVHNQRPDLLSFALVGAAWFASNAMNLAVIQINKTLGAQTFRPFWQAQLLSMALTFLLGLLVLAAILLIVLAGKLQGVLIDALEIENAIRVVFVVIRWAIIFGSLTAAFGLVYHLAPVVREKLTWVSPGAIAGVVLLVLASLGFQFYVRHFGTYQVIYGALGTVVVLMLWLYVCSLALLLGSEVNVTLSSKSSSSAGA